MEAKNHTAQNNVLKDNLKKQIDKALHPLRWGGKWRWIFTVLLYLVAIVIAYFIFIFIIIVVDYISPTLYLNDISNPNSARYLLSSLIQSQAAILAIVTTITLIAIQLAASSYSPRIIEIFFKRNIDFAILLLIYVSSIFYMAAILRIIPEIEATFQSQLPLQRRIDGALLISIFAFTLLLPYFWRTINLLKPLTIIKELSKDLTKENILQSANSDYNFKIENNPLVPIFEIIRGSCLRYDFETTRKGLKEIGDKGIGLINNNLSESETDSIILLFANELEDFGKLAVNRGDDKTAKETIIVLRSINKALVEKKNQKSVIRINASLELIGIAAIENKLLKTSQEAISSIYESGMTSIKTNPDVLEQSVLLLGDLARGGIYSNLEYPTYRAIRSIRSLGLMGVKERLERAARMALWSLELIGKTQRIYELRLREEKWEEIPQTYGWEGEIYEESVLSQGVENEISLFDEIVIAVFYVGRSSIKEKLYTVSSDAIRTLEIIGETTIKNRFDENGTAIFLGHLGIIALEADNKDLVKSSVEALKTFSIIVDADLEDTVRDTAWSLIRVGTVALQKDLNEIATSTAQILVNFPGTSRKKITIVKNSFDGSLTGIQEFKKMYLRKKVRLL
ncbi:putative membrane protein (DUF2254) [Candidatus Methanoperedens nitroreducens]|uniref:Putative membrane protein (DUF2254) n=2 Tax=Candidatus Methanoperedens nitratireducens TaxID=1392998 RepID=A0A062UUM4_9EURY|nr:putative membrane protein (DUF2254) [Candidatus Methanoperedens nitroreducens]